MDRLTFVVTMQRQSMAERRRQVEMYPNPRSPLSPLSLQLLSFSRSLSQRPPFAPLFFSVSLLTDLSIEENRVWREGGNVKRKGVGRRERENTRGFSKRGKDEERNAFVSMRIWEILQKKTRGYEQMKGGG
ncbi:hypothetical protein ABG768_022115 [Culter alburnus]|uniref:Uncharacterized protein n=1 Tax=Culter alburnus TaxID=194366 RepID=A0AAW2AK97_CULAL